MISNNEHIDDLIGKVLGGDANISERAQLDSWISESLDNKAYFDDVRRLFDLSSSREEVPEFDVDAAWNKVKSQIKTEPAKAGPKIISLLPSAKAVLNWRIAAAAVVVIGLGTLIFLSRGNKDSSYLVASNQTVMCDTLPDGSVASLNKNSSLSYEFDSNKKSRIAKLKGEAFFEIVHDTTKTFIIETQDVFIKDIGTAFNVKSDESADSIVVYVKEGEVSFYTKSNQGILITEGEEGVYIKSQKRFFKYRPEDANDAAYADKEFRFNRTPMKRVLKRINDVYYQQIMLENPQLEECRITVNFKDDDVETIATLIAETMGWKLAKGNGIYTLIGDSCQEE